VGQNLVAYLFVPIALADAAIAAAYAYDQRWPLGLIYAAYAFTQIVMIWV
jgi:hypothetical protein